MKRTLSLLLACLLCLTLLPAGAAAADEVQRYTSAEAESLFGISISTGSLNFGALPYNFQEDDVAKQTVTVTNNGAGPLTLSSTYIEPSSAPLWVGNPVHTTLQPGESYRLSVRPQPTDASGSFTAQVRLRAIPDAQSYAGPVGDGWGVGTTGTTVDVEVCTVSWSVAGFDPGAAAGALSLSVSSLDFGTLPLDVTSGDRPEQTFTITNAGPYPFSLDVSFQYNDKADFFLGGLFDVTFGEYYLEPGERTTVTVRPDDDAKSPIELLDSKMVITAEYAREYGGGTLTAEVPIHAKYLYDGTSYCISDETDLTYGHIVRADGEPFDKWGNPAYPTAGSSMTFYLEPYSQNSHILLLCVDGAYVGPLTEYTFTDIQEDHTLKAAFAPGAASSDWAAYDVGAAYNAGIYTFSEACRGKPYADPITRLEFCDLAANLCRKLGIEFPDYDHITFTDCIESEVRALAAMGVVTGVGNGAFNPDGQLTREQAATMLSRLAAVAGQPMPSHAPTFADNASIASWAYDAVGQVQADGIMGGVGNNTFAPQAVYSREQGIVTMYRLFEQLRTAA